MAAEVCIVSDSCPVGCGVDVVLLSAQQTAFLFAYCDHCGCTWADPAAARFERGLEEVTPLWVRAPHGVDFPTRDNIRAADLEGAILRTIPASEWWTTLGNLNSQIAREVAS